MMRRNLLLSAFASLVLAGPASFGQGCDLKFKADVTQPECFGICNGQIIITPDDPTAMLTFAWSTGATGTSIYNLCEDEYTVTITDDKGCSESFTYTIDEPDQLVASCVTLTNESAPGAMDGSLEGSATGGTTPYTFEWQTTPPFIGAVVNGLSAGTYFLMVYDANDCPASTFCVVDLEKQDKCEGHTTVTQGGWGQCQQNGNNPGTYLFNNFAAAFPGGLTIGCNNTLELTSAQAVCDFLPSGTTPKVLPAGAMSDPGASYSNVFAGQLVAATLNVQFDLYDSNFGSSDVNLGDMVIASGPFTGWTVFELLDEANKKIGGCTSAYKASKLSDALDKINNNFDNGYDYGYLECPDQKKDRVYLSEAVELSVMPNPASGMTKLSVITAADENLTVTLYNINGQLVSELFKGNATAAQKQDITFNCSSLKSGLYFVKVQTDDAVYTQKIMIKN